MIIGKSVTLAKSGELSGYMLQVLESTSELFFLLEGAEAIQRQFESGERRFGLREGLGPAIAFVQLSSTAEHVPRSWADEYGPEGRMAQLACVGWIAAVDGAWEKYRANPPFEKRARLRLGRERELEDRSLRRGTGRYRSAQRVAFALPLRNSSVGVQADTVRQPAVAATTPLPWRCRSRSWSRTRCSSRRCSPMRRTAMFARHG